MTPHRVLSRYSVRLALVAGASLAVVAPGIAAAGTDDPKPPTALAGPDTTVPGGKEPPPAPPSTATPTDGSAPVAAGTTEPLAVIDIASTGPGLDVGTGLDGAVAVANLEMVGMPIAAGASIAEYAANYSADLSDPAAPEYYGSLNLIATAQSEMPAAEILAAYQAAIETQGAFESTTSTASSEGVTSEFLDLDPVRDAAADTTAPGAAPTRQLGSYEIVVTRSEEAPGIVAIEVTQHVPNTPGPVPPRPAAVAADFTAPQAFGDANGWTVSGWSYRDGFNQFFGGAPFKSVDLDFSAGAGTEADLTGVADLILAEFGAPTYESVETDTFSYSFADDSSWFGSVRDYWVGNELNVSWSLTS